MSETVESKQQRLDKLKAQQRALLERAKAVEQRIRRAESAEKSKRRKQDDRTKLLVGVALLEAAQKNTHLRTMLREAIRVLKPADRTFLTEQSALWAEFEAQGKEEKPVPPQPRFSGMENPNDRPVRTSQDEIADHVTRAVQRINSMDKKP
ncbi:hypothetical protein SAMN02787149_1379 [Pseudomonas sp. Snoq117.2]|nr:hypothetical protein SAMN02787149_1379 [Pseudomonas sp. Snoq117.2]